MHKTMFTFLFCAIVVLTTTTETIHSFPFQKATLSIPSTITSNFNWREKYFSESNLARMREQADNNSYIVENTGVPVYVMLPLAVINSSRQVDNPAQLQSQLQQLQQQAHIDGVVSDVWWGLVEQTGPKQYYWNPYVQLISIIKSVGLRFIPIMSFHSCGGNVGDQCDIPLPNWATSAAPAAFYTDREGNIDLEYISLGADNLTLFDGRTPIEIYTDYMTSFRDNVLVCVCVCVFVCLSALFCFNSL